MRVGNNPNRADPAGGGFQKIIFVVVTHLPNQLAYHKDRLEVIQTCLNTMRHKAELPHSFLVWDNGSCPALRNWLQDSFKPDFLILSPNIGKTAARTSAIKLLPLGSIVAYSDDDMLFYKSWLKPQLALLQHYPNVSCVSGYPVRTSQRWGCENTKDWARKNAALTAGKFIPREWESDFARSIGRDPAWHEEYTKDDVDYLVAYDGVKAYATSHHCQFVAYAEKLYPALRYDGMAMGDEKIFDITLDEIGLRLCTTQRLSRHIGNVIDDGIRKDLYE